MQFRGIEHIRVAVRPSPSPISSSVFTCKTNILYILNNNSRPLPSPQPLAAAIQLSVISLYLTTSDTSYQWNHMAFTSLHLAYFT